MIRTKCPCCDYFTHLVESEEDPLFGICKVCFWAYDAVAHDTPEISIGANYISLNGARENYKIIGVCKPEFKHHVRPPLPEELPENNT